MDITEAKKNLSSMHGKYRIPTLLKLVDQLSRKIYQSGLTGLPKAHRFRDPYPVRQPVTPNGSYTYTMNSPNKSECEVFLRKETGADIEAITEVTIAVFKNYPM